MSVLCFAFWHVYKQARSGETNGSEQVRYAFKRVRTLIAKGKNQHGFPKERNRKTSGR